jgi:8-oxo-dGTP diphosphatase
MRRIAIYLLVDRRGWLLLQEKDDEAPRGANQWFAPGGAVEGGEDFEAAAYRELEEETGLTPPAGTLSLWRDEVVERDGHRLHYQLWAGRTDATDADIVVGEGRQIVFVDPARLPALDLWESAARFLPAFLASATYAALRGR